MGILDMAKMAQKAMKARSAMSKIKAAGKNGSLAMAIDGLYNVTDVEVDKETLKSEIGYEIEDRVLEKVINVFKNNIKRASADTKKALEKELQNNTSMDDLKSMLQ